MCVYLYIYIIHINIYPLRNVFADFHGASLIAQFVKNLPAVCKTQVRFLGQEGPLEKEMAIHSSTLAWKIPRTEEPDRLQVHGVTKSRTLTEWLKNTSIRYWDTRACEKPGVDFQSQLHISGAVHEIVAKFWDTLRICSALWTDKHAS